MDSLEKRSQSIVSPSCYECKMIEFAKIILVEGSFKSLINRVYSLGQIIEAYRYVDQVRKLEM